MLSSDPIIKDLEVMYNARNYRKWIFDNIKDFVGERIVEIGGGIGSFSEFFLNKELLIILDIHDGCIEYLKKKFDGKKNIFIKKYDISKSIDSFILKNKPDTIICINVLEHIKNDVEAVHNMFRLLRNEGIVVIYVPAYNWLYGDIDRLVGHYRRYSKNSIKRLFEEAGFKTIKIKYMNSIGILGWFINNRLLRRREESLRQVLFYDKYIIPFVKKIEGKISVPFGLSILAIAKK